jgi:hypothetical protein
MARDIEKEFSVFREHFNEARKDLVWKLAEASLRAYDERESLDADDHQAAVILEGIAEDMSNAIKWLEKPEFRVVMKYIARAAHMANPAEPEEQPEDDSAQWGGVL